MPTFDEKFNERIEKRQSLNGAPFEYWEKLVSKTVVDFLNSAVESTDVRSVHGHLVQKRLLELIQKEEEKF